MKVLMINGSPRPNGNTSIALGEMEKILRQRASKPKLSKLAARLSEAASAAVNARKPESVFLTMP